MAKNIIEEYLVSLGCQVNSSQFQQVNKTLNSFKNAVIAAFSIKAIEEFTKTISEAGRALGNITLGVDKLALNLHTTTKNARSLKTVMDAMGIDSLEDLKYINLIPEQRKQFMELRKVAAENAPSMQAREGLDELKKLGFEFQKFEVKLTSLGTEFLGGIGQALKEPLFKKVPQLLEVLLDLIKVIANEVVLFAKKFGSYKNFGDLNTRGFTDAQKAFRGSIGLKNKINIDPTDPNSIFGSALKAIFRFEGGYKGYTKSTGDPETNLGITSSTYSAYKKNHSGLPALKNINKQIATRIYKERYWDIFNSWNLDPKLHIAAFNAAVNMGPGAAGSLVKQSHGSLPTFFDAQRARYKNIAMKNPSQAVYLKGWLNRTNQLQSELQNNVSVMADKARPKTTPQPLGLGGVPGGANLNINFNIQSTHPKEAAEEVQRKLSSMLRSRDARTFA